MAAWGIRRKGIHTGSKLPKRKRWTTEAWFKRWARVDLAFGFNVGYRPVAYIWHKTLNI